MQVFGRKTCKAMHRLVRTCKKLASSYKLTIRNRPGISSILWTGIQEKNFFDVGFSCNVRRIAGQRCMRQTIRSGSHLLDTLIITITPSSATGRYRHRVSKSCNSRSICSRKFVFFSSCFFKVLVDICFSAHTSITNNYPIVIIIAHFQLRRTDHFILSLTIP